jgi:hypothetical protein
MLRFRLSTILLCLILNAELLHASPSKHSKFDPNVWVRSRIDALVTQAHAAFDDDEQLPAFRKVLDSINREIRLRKLSENEDLLQRYRSFFEYVAALSIDQRNDHQLGFVVSDQQYFRRTNSYVQIPAFLTTQSFLQDVSRYETLDRAKAYLRKINSTRESSEQLIFFSYTSRHLGTPDNDDSYRRLLIVVPGNGDGPEKWVQFGVTDPGTRVRTRNLSVVSAIKNGDGTFNAYFKDYFRTYRLRGPIAITGRWELGYGDDNCARCHKSGVLPIFPEENSVSPGEQHAVEAVNERFLTYGSPRFDSYLDESTFGPGLGSANAEQRIKRFGTGFNETVVGRAMNCIACHRPERLGYLNWPMDEVVISSYINGGHMPLGYDLEKAQREELYEKLIEEYFAIDDANPGVLKSWLLGKSRPNHNEEVR